MAVQATLDAGVQRTQDSSLGKPGYVLLGRKGTGTESWVPVTLPPVPLKAMKLLVASFRCSGWGEPPQASMGSEKAAWESGVDPPFHYRRIFTSGVLVKDPSPSVSSGLACL